VLAVMSSRFLLTSFFQVREVRVSSLCCVGLFLSLLDVCMDKSLFLVRGILSMIGWIGKHIYCR